MQNLAGLDLALAGLVNGHAGMVTQAREVFEMLTTVLLAALAIEISMRVAGLPIEARIFAIAVSVVVLSAALGILHAVLGSSSRTAAQANSLARQYQQLAAGGTGITVAAPEVAAVAESRWRPLHVKLMR